MQIAIGPSPPRRGRRGRLDHVQRPERRHQPGAVRQLRRDVDPHRPGTVARLERDDRPEPAPVGVAELRRQRLEQVEPRHPPRVGRVRPPVHEQLERPNPLARVEAGAEAEHRAAAPDGERWRQRHVHPDHELVRAGHDRRNLARSVYTARAMSGEPFDDPIAELHAFLLDARPAARDSLPSVPEPGATGPGPDVEQLRSAYLDLLKLCLCDLAGTTTVLGGGDPRQRRRWRRAPCGTTIASCARSASTGRSRG